VQVAYAIGVVEPVSIRVETFGTGIVPDVEITRAVRDVFDLTPKGIIAALDLRKPIYSDTTAYGHFGRTPSTTRHIDVTTGKPSRLYNTFTWERANKAKELKAAVR